MKRKICFWILATCGEGACLSTHTPQQSGGKKFYRWREGATCRNCTVSSVILKLICGGLISIILIALSIVNLQFQGQFIPISLRPILRIVAKLCHSCFPGGSDGKESACNAGDLGSLSGLGRSPGGGNGNPLQYSCLENSVDSYSPWGPKGSDMTEQLTLT